MISWIESSLDFLKNSSMFFCEFSHKTFSLK
jgi:hypothetical protein